MKKFLSLTVLLLLAVCILASCGGDGDNTTTTAGGPTAGTTGGAGNGATTPTLPVVTTTAPKVWNNPNVAVFADEIITWASDASADYYEVYLNGALHDTVANEYCDLDLADGQTATVKVVKVIDNDRYHSAEKSITRQFRSTRTVTSLSELSGMASNGAISLGGLTEAAVVLDLSQESGDKSMPGSLTVNPTLRSLTIVGNASLTLSGFSMKIEERSEPLTIIFRDVNLKTSISTMLYYNGKTSFTCDMLIKGTASFSNTYCGSTGANGGNAVGLSSAGNGATGGRGGDIFSLPKLRLFCENSPAFTTGNGGNGGNGGTGTAFAHGGFGGNGGRGGCVFRDTAVTCFTAFFDTLSGNFGSGGAGGAGGTGVSGPRRNGSTGAAGKLSTGGSFTYLSRTDGAIHGMPGDAAGDFNLSAINDYLIWNAQPSATHYEILLNGVQVDTALLNAYVVPPTLSRDVASLTVRAVLSTGQTLTSKPCMAITYDYIQIEVPSNSSTLVVTGAKSIQLLASEIKAVTTILVMPDVEHLYLLGYGEEMQYIEASIIANNRTNNLAITLYNVALLPDAKGSNAITVNNGKSISAATDPLLIINSYNSAIKGGSGQRGIDGQDANNLISFGGKGGNGTNGADGIVAPLVVIAGKGLEVQGGNGGDGGDGGDSNNEGGDGGNGGNGGVAIRTTNLYILMDLQSSLVKLYPSFGGDAGKGGNGFFGSVESPGTSATHGHPGSAGATLIGTEIILNGQLDR